MAQKPGQSRGEDEKLAVRRSDALELRVRGWSYRAIGKELGVSGKTAFGYVAKELEDLAADTLENVEEVRRIELERIDAATDVCMRFLTDSTEHEDDPVKSRELRLKAIDRLAKMNERRSKLLGLEAPQEIHSTITDDVSPQDIRAALKTRFGANVAPEIADDEASDNPDG